MIVIGIGNKTDENELVGIVGGDLSRKFHVTNFAALDSIEDTIVKVAEEGCKRK